MDAQLTYAHETLKYVPKGQLQAASTMKLAQAILSKRSKILEEMNGSGLWNEHEQLPEHHHLEHQLAKVGGPHHIFSPSHLIIVLLLASSVLSPL